MNRKYNFYNKISCAKYFNCDNDVELQKAILNEFDKLSNMEERQEFTSAIRQAGINIHNLNSNKSYTKHENEELSYDQAQRKLQEFRNALEEDEQATAGLSPYMKNLYDTDKDQFELASIINEAMEEHPEDNRIIKSQAYYKMQHNYAMKLDEYNQKQEQARQERKAEREAGQNSTVNIEDIWKELD